MDPSREATRARILTVFVIVMLILLAWWQYAFGAPLEPSSPIVLVISADRTHWNVISGDKQRRIVWNGNAYQIEFAPSVPGNIQPATDPTEIMRHLEIVLRKPKH